MISREFIRQLSAAADLTEIVGERVALKKAGNRLLGLCPFHDEKTPSFFVNPQKGFYYCFGCGANGDALRFVIQTAAAGDFMLGVELLAKRLGMPIVRGEGDNAAAQTRQALADAMNYFCQQLSNSPAAQQYLQQRGMQPNTTKQFAIGYAPVGRNNITSALRQHSEKTLIAAGLLRDNEKGRYDYFRHRIMFPILDGGGQVAGFGGRALNPDDMAKYLNSPDIPQVFSKKNVVFGIPQARETARKNNRIIITEGYMDVVMLAQAGFADSVAAMGTALSTQQMQKIGRLADNVILAFDGDNAGQKAAQRSLDNILPALRDGMSISFLFLPNGEDPDSFVQKNGVAAFSTALSAAQPLGDYLNHMLWNNNGGGNKEGQTARALMKGAKLLSTMSEHAPYFTEVLWQQLAAKAGISVADARRAAANAALATKAVAKTTSAAAMSGNSKNRYTMRDGGDLYNFLCCLAAHPQLIDAVADNPPLPGDNIDVEIVAAALNYLRWFVAEDGQTADIVGYLRGEGYVALAAQIRHTARRYAIAPHPEADFLILTKQLIAEQEKRTAIGRPNIWDDGYIKKIAAQAAKKRV